MIEFIQIQAKLTGVTKVAERASEDWYRIIQEPKSVLLLQGVGGE